jgi:hypothetical protein
VSTDGRSFLRISQLTVRRIRHRRWYVEEGAPGPISGAVASIADTIANCVSDVQDCRRRIRRSRKARAQAVQEGKAVSLSDEKAQSTGGAIAQLSQELAVEAVTGKPRPKIHNLPTKVLTQYNQRPSTSSTKSPTASITPQQQCSTTAPSACAALP